MKVKQWAVWLMVSAMTPVHPQVLENRLKALAIMVWAASGATLPQPAFSQAVAERDFPADAAPASADALSQMLTANSWRLQVADGKAMRVRWKSNGWFFVDMSPGYSDKGTWRAENGCLCVSLGSLQAGCLEVRVRGDLLFIKREGGAVLKLEPG